jgi:2-C-methyl-D-erythritol 4-phosphate cytidylyltransferase/2-C-methyl-D-erythritol 2,4-cyclodiphosphate synthase
LLSGLLRFQKLPVQSGIVLVHDAARPFVSVDLVGRSIEAAWLNGAAIPAIAVTDTIKRVDLHGRIVETPVRRDLKAVQTPQAFRFETILEAHRAAWAQVGSDFTDDASIAEWAGHAVYVFPGDADNVKLTTAADFAAARERLMIETETRTGIGYDVHAFAEGDHVVLGGVTIPHSHRLSGHSDADVVLHAVTDAILGALADGDIGSHFPPSDPQWKGAASRIFLDHAVALVKARGGRILHLDTVVICEAPKVGPHREAMRAAIAAICGLSIDRVGVKATTSEQLGFTGRREGIAAQAIATLALPSVASA